MADSNSPKDDGRHPLSLHQRHSSLPDHISPSPTRSSSTMQTLQKGAGTSRTMKIVAVAVILLCVLAIIRMWTNRQDVIAQKLAAPTGVQVIIRSSPLDKLPITAGTLPELEQQFRTLVVKFLSQQEILYGLSASDINQRLSVSSNLVTDNGQSIALFHWQATAKNLKDQVFMTLAYGSRDAQTHRILCLDRKPIDITEGQCANAIASVFHMKIQKAIQPTKSHREQ